MRYSKTQKRELHCAIRKLKQQEQKAIVLRFWGNCTIEEIAQAMHLKWHEADRLIDSAILQLKKKLLITHKGAFAE